LNKSRLTTNKQILTFLNENDYANAAKFLLQIQVNEWDILDDGYKNLSLQKIKSFLFDGFKVNYKK